jgi:hypothetical protein
MPQSARYAVSVFGNLLLYSATVCIDYYRRLHRPGADFTVEIGMPLKFWIEGGFGGLRLLMPGLLLMDMGIVIAIAVAVAWTWERVVAK